MIVTSSRAIRVLWVSAPAKREFETSVGTPNLRGSGVPAPLILLDLAPVPRPTLLTETPRRNQLPDNHLAASPEVDFPSRGVYISAIQGAPSGRPPPHHSPDMQ